MVSTSAQCEWLSMPITPILSQTSFWKAGEPVVTENLPPASCSIFATPVGLLPRQSRSYPTLAQLRGFERLKENVVDGYLTVLLMVFHTFAAATSAA